MVSDVKSCAGTIFTMILDIFLTGYKQSTESKCRTLLVNPNDAYTKFVPVLFPNPENPSSQTFLKTARLVKVHLYFHLLTSHND
jgi:hypothetical protein